MVGTESRKGQEKAAPTFLTITVKLVKKSQRVIYSRDTIELGYMCVYSVLLLRCFHGNVFQLLLA